MRAGATYNGSWRSIPASTPTTAPGSDGATPDRGRDPSSRWPTSCTSCLLLRRSHRPYVVVGHSTGGIIARQYAARHPDGLAGLVLVDSSHEDQTYRLAPFGTHRGYYARLVLRLWLRPLGLIRSAQDLGLAERPADLATPVS